MKSHRQTVELRKSREENVIALNWKDSKQKKMLDNAMGSNLQSNQTKSSLEIEGLLLKLTETLCAHLRDTVECGDDFTLIGSHKTCF